MSASKDLGNTMPIASPDARDGSLPARSSTPPWRHGGMWIAVWHPFVSGRLAAATR